MARGPVPKRSEDRTNGDKTPEGGRISKGSLNPVTTIPPTPRDWDPKIKRIYDGAKRSGQAQFFQDTDWAYLFYICSKLSEHELKPGSAMNYQTLISQLNTFLLTETDRRRSRIELVQKEEAEGKETTEERVAKLQLLTGGKKFTEATA